MTVKRIVPNFALSEPEAAKTFYLDILGLNVVMDFGWVLTLAADAQATPQISFASEGGAGTPVPDLSIEVDDVDEIYEKARAGGYEITRQICDEAWGVRRFFVRDPAGNVLNILSHKP